MDDFDRDVYCLAGLPFDAVSMEQAVRHVQEAAKTGTRCFLSTANLNFTIGCQSDSAFRDAVIHSDLNVADGMPIIWLAGLLGLPIRERVAGSSLFEELRIATPESGWRLSTYFFGGPEGVAEQACDRLNAEAGGMHCAGWASPGFVPVEEMSGEEHLAAINDSGADFLVVSLGARKGQAWIMRNLDRLSVPVVSHLGAVVNFVAGTVSRAPAWMQRTGLEWLWRIKEEPALWRRYLNDGLGLLRIVATQLLPSLWKRVLDRVRFMPKEERVAQATLADQGGDGVRLTLSGAMLADSLDECRTAFREAAGLGRPLTLDFSAVSTLDAAFLGLLLMLRKHAQQDGNELRLIGVSPRLRRLFYWNGVEYLLD